ncbi:hypothetical protein TYRP_012211 [Tyrophagus putrescentiae]|nr:hypothetical protein TYRP_012211 [Tyrophagus putrescentiae]
MEMFGHNGCKSEFSQTVVYFYEFSHNLTSSHLLFSGGSFVEQTAEAFGRALWLAASRQLDRLLSVLQHHLTSAASVEVEALFGLDLYRHESKLGICMLVFHV